MLKAFNESNAAKTFATNNHSSLSPNVIVEYDPAVISHVRRLALVGREILLRQCIRQVPKTKKYNGPQVIPMWQALTKIREGLAQSRPEAL